MISFFRIFPLKVWAGIGVLVLIAALYAGYRYQEARADRAAAEARTANVTADALDKAAVKTDAIRTETQEKQREVDEIEGSDTRLPDGYGRDLQRVRDGRSGDSR